MNDGKRAVLEETLEAHHRWMEAKAVGDLDDLALRNPELRPRLVVLRVTERHHRIQAVIAARQLDDDEDAVRMLLDARALKGLSGERGGRPIQDERQSRTETETVHSLGDEIAA